MGCKANPEWKLKHSGESPIARGTRSLELNIPAPGATNRVTFVSALQRTPLKGTGFTGCGKLWLLKGTALRPYVFA
jgi:hypothetical protein